MSSGIEKANEKMFIVYMDSPELAVRQSSKRTYNTWMVLLMQA